MKEAISIPKLLKASEGLRKAFEGFSKMEYKTVLIALSVKKIDRLAGHLRNFDGH